MSFLYLLEVDCLFVQTNLGVIHSYLVAFFVLFHKFLEVGARITHLLLTHIENNLAIATYVPLFDLPLLLLSNLLFKINVSNQSKLHLKNYQR